MASLSECMAKARVKAEDAAEIRQHANTTPTEVDAVKRYLSAQNDDLESLRQHLSDKGHDLSVRKIGKDAVLKEEPPEPKPIIKPVEPAVEVPAEPPAPKIDWEDVRGKRAASKKLLDDLTAEGKKAGLPDEVTTQLVHTIDDGATGKRAVADGQFVDDVIRIATDKPENVKPAYFHEVVHALRKHGLIPDKYWNALSDAAKRHWIDKYKIRDRYKGREGYNDEDAINEEAIAHAATEFRKGQLHPPGIIGQALKHISNILDAVRNWTRGHGFQSSDAIFKKIQEGRGAAEARVEAKVEPTVGEAKFSLRPDGTNEDEDVGVTADLKRLIDIFGPKMYTEKMADVTMKELLQNSFDGIKSAKSLGRLKEGEGQIHIYADRENRSIQMVDNGGGMSRDTVKNAFLKLAGTEKAGLSTAERSGGFGLAKMAFIFGNDGLKLVTVHDGMKTTLDTTGQDLLEGKAKLGKSEPTTDPNGTSVTVKIPKHYTDEKGNQSTVDFGAYRHDYKALQKPLIGDVGVKMAAYPRPKEMPFGAEFKEPANELEQRPYSEEVPIGRKQDLSESPLFTRAHFKWGDIDVYFGDKEAGWKSGVEVLSSGIHQFDTQIPKPGESWSTLPYKIILNVKPRVEADAGDYPFTKQREDWNLKIKKDIGALNAYLQKVYMSRQAQEVGSTFAKVHYMPKVRNDNRDVPAFDDTRLSEHVPKPQKTQVKLADEIEVNEGKATAGGETVAKNEEKLTDHDVSSKLADYKIPNSYLRDSRPIFHSNLDVDIVAEAAKRTGISEGRLRNVLSQIGTVVQDFRNELGKIPGYGAFSREAEQAGEPRLVGISLDKDYHGVNVKVPYAGFFLNPLSTKQVTPKGIGFSLTHTLMHEAAHERASSHNENFTMEMARLYGEHGDIASMTQSDIARRLTNIVGRNKDAFEALREVFNDPTTKNVDKSGEGLRASYWKGGTDGHFGDARDVDEIRQKTRRGQGGGGNAEEAERGSVPEGADTRASGKLSLREPEASKGKKPGRDGLFNPLPIPEDAATKVARKVKRTDGDVGAPANEKAIRLPSGVFVGPVNLNQWRARAEKVLTPAEIDSARTWYEDALPAYEKYFGKEDAPAMMGAWLMSNQNVSPAGAQHNALRVLEQYKNGTTNNKQGGLTHEKVFKYWDAILSGDKSKLNDLSTGQKIYDFIDSALGKNTRTFYGDDPRAGAPAVADVHSLRDMGAVDEIMQSWVREKFGDKFADKITPDPKLSGQAEARYEWAADKMRDFTDQLNKQKWQGRDDWKPRQVQAVGWMAMSKMLGRKGETAEQAISSNIHNLSYELDFGKGAPWNEKFPEWQNLQPEQKAKISEPILGKIADFVTKTVGTKEFVRIAGTGAWGKDLNASFRSRLISTPEVAADAANMVGYLAQQTAVVASRPVTSKTSKLGLIVSGEGLDKPSNLKAIWDKVVSAHPDLAVGFSPSKDANGVPAMELLFDSAGAKLDARLHNELMPTFDAAAKEIGLDVEIKDFRHNTDFHSNDWENDPDGRSYIQRLSERYGPDIQARLDAFNRSELEPALRRAIDEEGTGEKAGTGKEAGVESEAGGKLQLRSPEDRNWEEFGRVTDVNMRHEIGPDAGLIERTTNNFSKWMELKHPDILDNFTDIKNALKMSTNQMSAGSDQSRALAKDFMNALRVSKFEWNRVDKMLQDRFTPEERQRMWEAADEQSVLEQQGKKTKGKGLDTLTPEQRSVVKQLQAAGQKTFDIARKIEMIEGEGLPSYVPRMIVDMATGKAVKNKKGESSSNLEAIGTNLRTTSKQLLHRQYLTTAETEAAAKVKFGPKAEVVRDIRTLALATAKLQNAIAGRTLMNKIREIGQKTGKLTVAVGGIPHGTEDKWFTLEQNPAFWTWRPKMQKNPNTEFGVYLSGSDKVVKWHPTRAEAEEDIRGRNRGGYTIKEGTDRHVPLEDEHGNTVFEKVPLYVRGDFEGPLRAVLQTKNQKGTETLLNLKGKAMSAIMFNPLTHNAVIFGKAFPAMPGKFLGMKVYSYGRALKQDVSAMHEAIGAGLVPIGARFGFQDISSIAEEPNIAPGQSWTAKLLAAIPGLVKPEASVATKRAVDKLGDFWHNTLLWDRVGDLQMGLYGHLKDRLIEKGFERPVATKIAAHIANRYAGSIPLEAMSKMSRVMANLLLFSRSFTLSNIGSVKDTLLGLPSDIRSQIVRDQGEVAAKAGDNYLRKKSATMIVADLGMSYLAMSVLQSALNVLYLNPFKKEDRDFWDRMGSRAEKETQNYIRRMNDYMSYAKENPENILDLRALTPMSDNEAGKRDRIRVGKSSDGSDLFFSWPMGKVPEEIVGWFDRPLERLKAKMSTFARPILQTLSNDRGFGRKVYDPYDDTPGSSLRRLGDIVWNFMQQQAPTAFLDNLKDVISGEGDPTGTKLALASQLIGSTTSRGFPGGPEKGLAFEVKQKEEARVGMQKDAIKALIKSGKYGEAQTRLIQLGMTPREAMSYIRNIRSPRQELTGRQQRDFNQAATPEDKGRMQRLRDQRDESLSD